jgi:hypothetical protein
MMTITVPRIATLSLALALGAGAAQAQTPGQPTTQQACAADVKTYCGAVKPGAGNPVAACMKQNEAKLSSGCKAAIQRTQQQRSGKSL